MILGLSNFLRLLDQLGYSDLDNRETAIFLDDLMRFTRSSGFRNEHSSAPYGITTEAYQDLAYSFLELHGRGQIYWPDTGRRGLRYVVELQK